MEIEAGPHKRVTVIGRTYTCLDCGRPWLHPEPYPEECAVDQRWKDATVPDNVAPPNTAGLKMDDEPTIHAGDAIRVPMESLVQRQPGQYNEYAEATGAGKDTDIYAQVAEKIFRPQSQAAVILHHAAKHISMRAIQRDQPEGERSMARTVAAFNAVTGHEISERDGWIFMAVLKAARACNTADGTMDDYEDGAAYFALAGESTLAKKENT